MKENTQNGARFTWVRDLAFVVAIVGGAWVIADAIGELKAEQARTGAKVEHNAVLIERNARAIDRNAEAIDRNAEAIDRNAEAIARNAEAIDRNAEAIGEVNESVAKLAGQYAEHTREHQELASR